MFETFTTKRLFYGFDRTRFRAKPYYDTGTQYRERKWKNALTRLSMAPATVFLFHAKCRIAARGGGGPAARGRRQRRRIEI